MGNRVLYKDQAVEPFSQFLQDDLTGQVNFKIQYPMTKTITSVVQTNCTSLSPSAMMPSCTDAAEARVWDFEFWSLEFV